MKSFKQYLSETFHDSKSITLHYMPKQTIEVFRNPSMAELKEIQKLDKNEGNEARGFCDSNGNLFIWNVKVIHVYALDAFKFNGKTKQENLQIENGVCVQIRNNNVFVADSVIVSERDALRIKEYFNKCRKLNPQLTFIKKKYMSESWYTTKKITCPDYWNEPRIVEIFRNPNQSELQHISKSPNIMCRGFCDNTGDLYVWETRNLHEIVLAAIEINGKKSENYENTDNGVAVMIKGNLICISGIYEYNNSFNRAQFQKYLELCKEKNPTLEFVVEMRD